MAAEKIQMVKVQTEIGATNGHTNGHGKKVVIEEVVPYYYTTALRMASTPKTAEPLARGFSITILTLILIAFIPNTWQQNVAGSGTVTSFVPATRPQTIDAQIDGRIIKWYVNEGAIVKAGDTIATLRDIDTKFLAENFVEYQRAVRDNTAREAELEIVQAENKVRQAEQKLKAAKQVVEQANVDVQIARTQYWRAVELERQGLVARKDLENATLKLQKSIADSAKAAADLQVEIQAVRNANAELAAKQRKAEAIIAKADLELGNVSTRRNLGVVISPIDGQVTRIAQAGPGQTVKKGETLCIVTPNASEDVAAEIFIGSLDAAIIDTGRPVRLQFAGFPAIQVWGGGWPNLSVGTFGGKVAVVDAVDDGSGRYRVLVVPDPNDKPWPNRSYLRQGTEVTGWILLNEVSLAYEAWRQLCGFPPTIPVRTGGMDKKKGGADKEKKSGKSYKFDSDEK
ncbi:MAG: HlyD family secretion protein [Candidatus Thermochlorobacter sp.]